MQSSAFARPESQVPEETLDPHDWSEFRALSHRILDDTLDYLSSLRDRPTWQSMPSQVRASLTNDALPLEPLGLEKTYSQFLQNVRPYPNGNNHARFWGWVQGTGTPVAMLADMLAAAMNPHMAGFNQAPALVEAQVLQWLSELMGFPSETSGLLVTGGTMANLLGLAVARHGKAGFDVRERGLHSSEACRLVFYASTETHGWCQKSAELLGLGNRSFHRLRVKPDFTMDTAALCEQIAADRAANLHPFCIVGNAGTINTGATDDLAALARIAREEDLWFHVDGAFGALARLSEKLRPIVAGMEHADSLAFDLHKWMYLPFEVGCILVRDPQAHRAAFALNQSYFGDVTRGVIAGGLPFAERGIELTRSFRALKVWFSLKTHGIRAFARLIEQNVAQARYLESLIAAHDNLELLAPVTLNTVCFRYVVPNCDDAALNSLNQELLLRLQESGTAVISSTLIRSGDSAQPKFALRAAITNHRSRFSDFDLLVSTIVQLGAELNEQV